MSRLPAVCVIGAGASGLAAAKQLAERGFPFDCFEATSRVGGLWAFGNGASAAYRSLHINTSRARMEFSDFPMPPGCPDFPHHTQVAAYLEAYADRFRLRDRITFDARVEHAARDDGGLWRVTLADGETRAYDALLVANGHHWDPRWPEPFPGQDAFAGRILHSHEYRGDDPELLRDKAVVVLGMGNSAMDIAVDSSFAARATYLAARRGAWVIPKYVLGRPLDQISTSARIPVRMRRRLQGALLRAAVGDMTRYGLPRPDHPFGAAHPTISDLALSRLAHGAITAKPTIAEFGERSVRFTDRSEADADVVVFCTGYKVTFPFFDPDFIAAPGNDLPLFRRVFHPKIPGVYFIGLLQPLGALMPLAELQSAWVCDHLAGRYVLPPPEAVRADVEAERAAMFGRYVRSERHTMQVDFEDYVEAVRRERRAGARRAARAGAAARAPVAAHGAVGTRL